MSQKHESCVSVPDDGIASVKKREPVHLPWYKTQYWSGFVSGFEIGALTGLPMAFVVYQLAKLVVFFIEGV